MAAYSVFYPAAALYAAFIVPASVLGLVDRAGHAHEMLFGFALAVVAGNQLGAVSRRRVAAVFALWLSARVAFLAAASSAPSVLLNVAFAGALAWHTLPRLFGAAKKLRNQALPATLTALCAAAIYWQLARAPVRVTVMLFALLLLFMGGRIVAPAIAGQLYRQGESLDARVQPRIEGALIVLAGVAAAALALDATTVAGTFAAASGVLAGVRLARWRLWRLRGRADLWCLAAGYAWLSLGLLAFGAALLGGRFEGEALHVITVGALGTLTFNVMALAWTLKARRYPADARFVLSGTGLLAAATVGRVLGGPWLVAAALCWAGAYAVLLGLFALSRASPARS